MFFFPTNRVQQTDKKIVGFGQLPKGWHYGSGDTPSDETIQKARKLNSELSQSGFTKTNAFPGIDGEIQVTAYHDSLYLEFTIEPDGKIVYIYEYNDEEVERQDNMSLDAAIRTIRNFRGRVWVLSESFIKSITTPINEISKVLPSNRPVMVAESQSLTMDVYPEAEPALVSTSIIFTKTSPEYRPFFGKSLSMPFLQTISSYNRKASQEMIATITS